MKHHAFSPRSVAAAVAMAIVLAGGTTTGAMAAVTSASAASARQGGPTAPAAPTGLTATAGDGTATLAWSAPSSDGGSPVDFYVIEGGASTSGAIVDKVGGFRHATTISGLTNGTTYDFRVHAQNAYGDGASAAAQVTPRGPASVQGSGSVPGPPAGLKTSYGDGFISLSWSPPPSTGGSPITGYHVYLGHSPSLVGARVFVTSGTSFRDADAENGSQYYIKVTALNAAGEGRPTPVTSVIPVPHAAPGPSRPTGLTVHARRGAVVLAWSPPKDGLKAGEGYVIYSGTSSGHEGAKPSVPYLIQGATSYRIAPLKDGTRYYFQVALVDGSNRVSARSAEVSAVPGARSASGPAAGSSAGSGAAAGSGATVGSGADAAVQPSASPLAGSELAQNGNSSSLPTGLIVLLVALVLAVAAFGTTAIMLIRRQRYDRRYDPGPAPRRPYDDQPTVQYRRAEEMNGPRYR